MKSRAGLARIAAPWRMTYIAKADEPTGCLFCRVGEGRAADDRRDLVLVRRDTAVLMLNRYPYTPAHLMVAIKRHAAQFRDLTSAERLDVMDLTALAENALEAEYQPHGINYGLNGVLRLYYSAPLFALVAGKAADNFHEIFAVSKLITEHKGCTVVADGNFVGDVTGTTTIKNIGKCSGDYRFNYSGFFSIDAKAGSPTSMLAAFTLDETALAAVPPDCPGSYAESIIDLCTTFRVVDKAFEAVPDELLCSVYSNYKIVFDSSGSKATVTWLLNAHNNIWMGTIQGVTVAKKK